CKQILEMDPCVVDQDALGLTFTWEVEELGVKKVVELCPEGNNISVNSINKNKYIDRIIEHQFVTAIAEQLSKFSQGFLDIVGNEKKHEIVSQELRA
nr:E3 ubiquitin-protein ligase UPL5 [Tanacetum cinerariifolium]